MSSRVSYRNLSISAAVALATAIPATFGFASETSLAATISAALPAMSSDDAHTAIIAEGPGEAVEAPVLALDPPVAATPPVAVATVEDASELECMAKIVHHEAANQPRAGQLAVAQLVMNRVESGRFADTVCGVANQPRQFFDTSAYHPRRDSSRWKTAMDVAREAMAGHTADVVPGALFYHATYIAPPRFFRSRPRAGVLGDHIFYR